MTDLNSLEALSIDVAQRFLQTVIVVDDLATFGELRQAAPIAPPAAGKNDAPVDNEPHGKLLVPATTEPVIGVDQHELDAKRLIDAFAEKGLVCAVLRPDKQEDVKKTTGAAARRADIVVFDWIMHRDDGATALQLIDEILDEDQRNDRVRLLAVYTGEPKLSNIASRIQRHLSERFQNVTRIDDFRLRIGAINIVIYAKPQQALAHAGSSLAARVKDESDLPTELIAEFGRETTGLLRNAAISALAALREQTHKVLRVFDQPLDAAYLGHRLLLPAPSDAEAQIVAVIASELQSVLEQADVGQTLAMGPINAWIKAQVAQGADFAARLGGRIDGDPVAAVSLILKDGIEHRSLKKKYREFSEQADRAATELFASPEEAEVQNLRLAKLMMSRTRYGEPAPRLSLGTILRTLQGARETYWLCLQPRCDSTRLSSLGRPFPMLRLKAAAPDDGEFHIVVLDSASKYLRLRVRPKAYEIQMAHFTPTSTPSGDVAASLDEKGFFFTDSVGQRFDWVAELKDDYAQKYVNLFAADVARPGIDECEWVRRSGKARMN
jgi:hypothetical protein